MSEKEDHLFELIRNLSPSEKRHFSLYASRHTIGQQNNSLRMFKKLDALKTYDEKKFLEKNKKEAFVKHYSFNKHFLYKLILQSLHAFHKDRTEEMKLRDQLHSIDILAEKGLLSHARALIKSAQKKAEQYQFHNLLLELLNRDMALNREEAFAGKGKEDIAHFLSEHKKFSAHMNRQAELETYTARLSLEASKGGLLRNKETFQELHEMQKEKHLTDIPETFYGAWHFYSARVGIHFLTMEPAKALADNSALLKVMEDHWHLVIENPRHYLLALNNQMVLLSNLKRYEEMLETSRKLEAVPVRTQVLRNRKFNTSYGLILQMYAKTGEFKKGLDLLEKANNMLSGGEVQFLNRQFEISHFLASANIHFGAGNFSAANKNLQQIIDRRDLTLRDDILYFALIMRIIVQYEMQKQDLLEYTVRSAWRYLHKRDRLYKFEGIVLDFIRKKSPHLDSQKKLVNAFKELHEQLLPLTKEPSERNAFAYFDIMSWLESKVHNRSYEEVVRGKYADSRT